MHKYSRPLYSASLPMGQAWKMLGLSSLRAPLGAARAQQCGFWDGRGSQVSGLMARAGLPTLSCCRPRASYLG